LIESFITNNDYVGLVAVAKDADDKTVVIGACIYQHTTPEDFRQRNYNNPFPKIDIDKIDLFYVPETFKRKINDENNIQIRRFSLELKRKMNQKICESYKEVLIFSATQSRYMLNIFKMEDRKILENNTGDGWRYQGYLYLKCSS